MRLTEYPICQTCFKKAAWQYAGDDYYLCDDCLPRKPCSCNYQLKEDVVPIVVNGGLENPVEDWELLYDEKGRLHPCVDWNKL